MTNKWDPNSYRNKGIDLTGADEPALIENALYNKDLKIWDMYHAHKSPPYTVFLNNWRNEVTLALREALDESNETTSNT